MLTSFSAVFFAPLTAENKVCFFSPEPPEAHARTPRVKKAKVKDPFNLTPLFAQALGQYSGGCGRNLLSYSYCPQTLPQQPA
ncbi:hypothetical protein K523DRAFT_359033 [Schizophyllum commune Tattone D]|nr:hypothetical protein K523DRAFT_359033 [Schizophyllum commune Tattone D]